MSYRKKVNEAQTAAATVQYQNKFAQIVSLVRARKTFIEYGRGAAKTTDIICELILDLIQELPGAPIAWLADTFSNLTANVLPSVLEGLERKGLHEGIHFVIEQRPPEFTDKEKENLPAWLKPHFWTPVNHMVSYKRTIIFYSGLNITFGSLDRPSTLAGRSYVFVIGDEAKYFRPEQVANLLKAVRGYPQYRHSPLYRGQLFTSDVADPSHVGEYAWMNLEAKNVDIEAIMLVMKAGLVYNEALHEAVAAKDEWLKTGAEKDRLSYINKLKTASRWRERWMKTRKDPRADTFYFRASSFVNADILGTDWFEDAIASGLPDLKTSVLSMRTTIESGDRFYANLSSRHFYFDGINEAEYDKVGLQEEPDSRILRYCNPSLPLRLGVDFGNMCSMTIGQNQKDDRGKNIMRILKFIYTLAPEYVDDLGRKFRRFFAPMANKVVYLFYDRAGNAYKQVGKDQVSQLKRAIERDESGRPTGWTVQLMNRRQGDIRQTEEYNFMQVLMGENNPRLPLLRIDAYQAKELKLSLERARTKVKNGVVYKDKSSERLEIIRLPKESTNPSDSFKYLMMIPEWREAVKGGHAVAPGNLDITTK